MHVRYHCHSAIVCAFNNPGQSQRRLYRGYVCTIERDSQFQSCIVVEPQPIQIQRSVSLLPDKQGLRCSTWSRPPLEERIDVLVRIYAHRNHPDDPIAVPGINNRDEDVQKYTISMFVPVEILKHNLMGTHRNGSMPQEQRIRQFQSVRGG